MKRHNFLCLIAFLVAIQPAQATAQDAAASPAEAPQRATTARAILLWGPSDSAEGSARAREALEARLDPD